jgi:hypothetical protein
MRMRSLRWSGLPPSSSFVAVERLAAELVATVEHLPQQLAGVLAEALALRRQPRRIDAAVDQVKAEPGLQRLDAAAEGGLRRIPLFGGAREIAGFGHRQEILQPAQLHHAPRVADDRRDLAITDLGLHRIVDADRREFSM